MLQSPTLDVLTWGLEVTVGICFLVTYKVLEGFVNSVIVATVKTGQHGLAINTVRFHLLWSGCTVVSSSLLHRIKKHHGQVQRNT